MNSQKNQFNRFKNKSGKNVEVLNQYFTKITTVAIIKEFNNGNNSTEDKTIFFDIKDNIQQGDLIQYENNTYIILLQEENINNVYMRYVMRRCDHTIKIYINNKLEEIPCNISTFTQDTFENQYVKLPTGNIKITCQNNDITQNITQNMRFIKMGICWKVIGYTSENKGLKYLYCEKTEFDGTNDDIKNEIADYWKHNVKHNYSITVTEDNITLEEGQTKQLIVNITDNIDGKVENVVNPTIIYTSNNDNITIDDKGVITGITEGTSTIKITFGNVEKTINIKVVKPLPIVTTYSFKTILLDNVALTTDSITLDNGTSKVLKVTEITKTTTQGDKSTTEIINNPVINYSVDNSNITVDIEGKINTINAGNCILTISYENIKKDINISINDAIKLEIIGKDYIIQGFKSDYTSNISVTWSVEDEGNDSGNGWITIVSSTDTNVKIKATSDYIWSDGKNKYTILKATSKDGSATIEKKIQIKPL